MIYFNIHTHHRTKAEHELAVFNVSSGFGVKEQGPVSCGLHPWYLEEDRAHAQFELMRAAAKHQSTVAIGECGLDKACNVDWHLQMEWFEKQVHLANELELPIVLHCVRAYEEVLGVLSSQRNKVPVVFHGFHKHEKLAERLLQSGAYLSFGKHLVQPKVREVFASIPLTQVFLETDGHETPISDVYNCAAEIRQIEVEEMVSIIWQNATTVFGNKLDPWKI